MENKKITIYTSTTCPYCDMAKDYFRTKGIPYEEMSTSDPENRKKLVSMGIRGVPAIFIGEKYFVGFDPVEIEKLMAESEEAEAIVEQEIVPEGVAPVEPVEAGPTVEETTGEADETSEAPLQDHARDAVVEVPAEDNTVENAGAQSNKEEGNMTKYICQVCGYVYDPAVGDEDNGIAPGTSFEALPEDWVCPLCGVGKDQFEAE